MNEPTIWLPFTPREVRAIERALGNDLTRWPIGDGEADTILAVIHKLPDVGDE